MKPFWEIKSLTELDAAEWESLCDGCGRCCLRKLEDPDSGEISYTDVACRLLDTGNCRCRDYPNRHRRIEDCVRLDPNDLAPLAWMPSSCAYRLVAEKKPLPDWHPLVSGSARSVQDAGISVSGRVISEAHVHEDEVEFRIIDWVRTRT